MRKHWKWILPMTALIVVALTVACWRFVYPRLAEYGFARQVSDRERAARLRIVQQAESWLETREGDGRHQELMNIYNSHEPLARGYEIGPNDNWCAVFGSVAAIQCGMTDRIPTECGCERQIGLFADMGRWV